VTSRSSLFHARSCDVVFTKARHLVFLLVSFFPRRLSLYIACFRQRVERHEDGTLHGTTQGGPPGPLPHLSPSNFLRNLLSVLVRVLPASRRR